MYIKVYLSYSKRIIKLKSLITESNGGWQYHNDHYFNKLFLF